MKWVRFLLFGGLCLTALCGCAGTFQVSITVDVDATWEVERAVTDGGEAPVPD